MKKIKIPLERVVKFNTTYVYFEDEGKVVYKLFRGKRRRHHVRHDVCMESHRDFYVTDVEQITFTPSQCRILGLRRKQALRRWRL